MKKRFIGLSLSFCIKDILSKKVDEKDVLVILTGTKLETPEQWIEMIDLYRESYWEDFSYDQIIQLLQKLKPRIIQPALNGQDRINLSQHLGNPWITDTI